jgi:histone H3/H4
MIKDNVFLDIIFSSCRKALENYNNSKDTDVSRQKMANILFPVSIAEKFIRNFGHNNLMITASSPIYLACFLEILTKKILTACLTISENSLSNRLTIRHLFLTIEGEPVIKDIFKFCDLKLIGGGVKPEIHCFLKNKKRKKNTKKEAEPKKHRFRPGTIALREIKKYQENYTDKLIFAKLPFEKLVRKIIYEKTTDNIKISKEFFTILQYWLEDYLISFLKDCNLASIHAKRVKVSLEDLEFIRKLRGYPEIETV